MLTEVMIAKWLNNEKTQIAVKGKMDTGAIQQLMVEKYNLKGEISDQYKALLTLYSEEQIEADTERMQKQELEYQQSDQQRHENEQHERIKIQYVQRLFEAKLELFEIPEIKNSSNRELRSKIRRAKSVAEAYVFGTALLLAEQSAQS